MFPTHARIFLVAGVTDMRKSFNGLAAIVTGTLRMDTSCGYVFVFCNRRHNRLKTLHFDGSGLWVCAKVLEKGTFRWPGSDEAVIKMTFEELVMLLGGLDVAHTKRRHWYGCG